MNNVYMECNNALLRARALWYTPADHFSPAGEKWNRYNSIKNPAVNMIRAILKAINPDTNLGNLELTPWEEKRT